MTFAEKLKSIRKQVGMSQELLAEKIGVSRQAVTKWETGAGIPDIENMISISNLFNISIDELICNERTTLKTSEYLFESITEYDIDKIKSYDMNLEAQKSLYCLDTTEKKFEFVWYLTFFLRFKMILK